MLTGILIFSIVWIIFIAYVCYKNGYEDGQIDALNGNIKYEKKENNRGEITWWRKSNKFKSN